jgi:hypothetical protein
MRRPGHLRRRRPAWSHLLGVTAVVLAAGLATASAYAHQPPSVLPTVASVAGTCHLALDPFELSATLSDTAPAVPCDSPHQTQTDFQLPLTGSLAAQTSRPNPELLNVTYAESCASYDRIRRFLGARPPDVYWGVSAYAKFPTRAEWASGVRTLVCDLSSDTATPAGPQLTQSLAGILRRQDSAAFRLCRLGSTLLTCNRLHDAEATSPNVILLAGPWPGAAAVAAEATKACGPVAAAYLTMPIGARPGLSLEPTSVSEQSWARGMRSVSCWIGSAGAPTTGTLRGGLR